MTKPLIRINNLQIYDTIISARIAEGELIAIIGPNKSGKTTLAEILRGEIRDFQGTVINFIDYRQISYSAYSADNNFFHYSDFYYQQRYNTFDVANVDTVEQYLQFSASDGYMRELFHAVLPQSIFTTKIIELSSGETRKVLLLKNLFKEAKIYILDNPFSGLDEASVLIFVDLFKRITKRYGKTIILLLNDNPLKIKFTQTIHLGRKGSGESIWDIKSKIGFISSEIQLYFNRAHSVQDIILSGFSDTMVLNRRINDEEEANYRSIIETLGLARMENAAFGRLSSGEKKTVMIARAVVKNPPVLILDEPFGDLDCARFSFLHHFLAKCADENRTVIQTAHHDREILPGMDHIALIENEALTLIPA